MRIMKTEKNFFFCRVDAMELESADPLFQFQLNSFPFSTYIHYTYIYFYNNIFFILKRANQYEKGELNRTLLGWVAILCCLSSQVSPYSLPFYYQIPCYLCNLKCVHCAMTHKKHTRQC